MTRREMVDILARMFTNHFLDHVQEYADSHSISIVMDPQHIDVHTGPNLHMALELVLGMASNPEICVEDVDQGIDKILPKFARQAAVEYLECITEDGP